MVEKLRHLLSHGKRLKEYIHTCWILSEKDASLVADHLLELCPTLKRGQAEFYARHCTIGKYYNIQQYKEFNDVAYETARTSMDLLADYGFYRKELFKNKYIYTPVTKSYCEQKEVIELK